MILYVSICLTLVAVILNLIFILLTRKFKNYKPIIALGDKYKKECIKALNKLWKNQIIIVAIGITLSFLYAFVDIDNKIVLNTFIILCNIYSFISIVLGIYNYNSFNKSINNLLDKTSK